LPSAVPEEEEELPLIEELLLIDVLCKRSEQSASVAIMVLVSSVYLSTICLIDWSSAASCTQIPNMQDADPELSTILSSRVEHRSIKYGACRLIFSTVDIFKMKSTGPVKSFQIQK